MDITTLPRHTRTGVLAVGWRKARTGETPGELYPIWPVLGAADDADDDQDGDDDAGDGDQDGADDDGQDDDQDPAGADQLGDAGKKALDAQKARWKSERDKRKALERQLADLQANGTDATDPEQIRTEAEKAATAKANARIVRSEVRAAAVGKLANPKDALVFLDLDAIEVDDDGAVDDDEIAEAIEDLLKERPYLAAQGGRRFQGSGDGGARNGSKTPTQVTEDELDKMTPDQIDKARREGRLNDLLGVKR